MAYYDGSSGAIVFEAAITGTFSAGKTTTLDMLRDPALAEHCELEEPYGVSLIEVGPQMYGEGEADQLMPVLTVSEASRRLAEQEGDPTILGRRYNSRVQHRIGFEATAYLLQGRAQLARIYPKLRKEHGNIANAAVILGDRSHLDSEVYFGINFSDEDHTTFGGVPIQRDRRCEAVTSLDVIFVADAREVPFEKEDARPADAALRLQVQDRLVEIYSDLTKNPLNILEGSPEERREQVIATLGALVSMPFVAQSPLTGYLSHRELF